MRRRTIIWKLWPRPTSLPHRTRKCLPESATAMTFVFNQALHSRFRATVSAKCIPACVRGSTGAELNDFSRRMCILPAEVRPEWETVHRWQPGRFGALVAKIHHTRKGGEGSVPTSAFNFSGNTYRAVKASLETVLQQLERVTFVTVWSKNIALLCSPIPDRNEAFQLLATL